MVETGWLKREEVDGGRESLGDLEKVEKKCLSLWWWWWLDRSMVGDGGGRVVIG